MNDRRSEGPGSDDDSYGNRSWEEFLRDVRGEKPREPSADDEASSREKRAPEEGPGDGAPQSTRVVVPPENEFEGAHRRRRRLLIGGASAVLLLVGAFLVYDQVLAGRDGGGARTGQGTAAERVDPPGPGTGEDPVAAADSPDTSAPTDPPRPSSGAEGRTVPFATRADTLAEAIASFQERRRDFGLGRIGCEGLTRGLREVQSAFTSLREVAGEDGERLGPPARERFLELLAEVRSVEDAFAGSGCPGPP